MSEGPTPNPTAVDEPFWAAAERREFRMQRCSACGYVRWPPSPVCPDCWASDHEWVELDGHGTLVTWATFHTDFFDDGVAEVPYTVVEVELDEGPRYLSLLVDSHRDDLEQGLSMTVRFHAVGNSTVPVFGPEE